MSKLVLLLSGLSLLVNSGIIFNPTDPIENPDEPIYSKEYGIDIDSDIYGPFLEHESGEHSFTIRFRQSNIYKTVNDVTIHLQVFNQANGRIVLTRYFRNLTVQKRLYTSITFTLPISSYLNSSGLRIVMDLASSDGNYDDSYDFILYPYKEGGSYNLNQYVNKKLVLKGTTFQFKSGALRCYDSTFKFSNYVDYFYIDRYYRLTLNQFNFTYEGFHPLTYEEAYFCIEHPPECFSHLFNDEGKVVIPLEIINSSGTTYSFRFKSGLYVNRKTLDMSLYYINSDYVATTYFYLPHNCNEEVLGSRFNFYVNGVDTQEVSFHWYSIYNTDHQLLGDCANSDYCIVGDF